MIVPIASVVGLLCVLVYGVGLNGPLFFDDVPNLLDNLLVQIDGTVFDSWRVAALSSDSGLLFRPLAMLTFALNFAAAGAFTPFSLKATNLAIHLGTAVLVYYFALAVLATPALRTLRLAAGKRSLVAVFAASIWLLHPIHVSTVLYAVQRMAQLSAFFTLAGLLVYTRYRLRWAAAGAGPGEVAAAFIWLALLAVLAALSKENGALLPWLIAVVEVTLFCGIWAGNTRRTLVYLGWFALLLPLLLVTLVYVFLPEMLTGRFAGREFTLDERLFTQGRALWQYLGWLVIPNVMEMGFFHDDIAISRGLWAPYTTVLALLAWACAVCAAVVWRKRYPLFAFALFFYLVGHSLESSVWPLEMVFEHRNYLPGVGVLLLMATGIFQLAARFGERAIRGALGGTLGLLVLLLAVRTIAWCDEVTLARFNVVNHPQSPRANFFYGNALFKRFEQARSLALSEEEQRDLAVTSRRYFERMNGIDERDFAALVMLYQLDTMLFPGLAEKNDWITVMQELAMTRRLQKSDYTALGALVQFSLTESGVHGRPRIAALVDDLLARNPGNIDLLALKIKMLAAAGTDQRETWLASLERNASLNPDNPMSAVYRAQYYGTDDLANTYEAVREWLRLDRLRRELPLVRRIFDS